MTSCDPELCGYGAWTVTSLWRHWCHPQYPNTQSPVLPGRGGLGDWGTGGRHSYVTVTSESRCFARKSFYKLTPGLFKIEWRGDGFVGLWSKAYYCFCATDKYSTKGLSKRHNDIDKDTFLACWQTDGAVVGPIGAFACAIRQWWRTFKSEPR